MNERLVSGKCCVKLNDRLWVGRRLAAFGRRDPQVVIPCGFTASRNRPFVQLMPLGSNWAIARRALVSSTKLQQTLFNGRTYSRPQVGMSECEGKYSALHR